MATLFLLALFAAPLYVWRFTIFGYDANGLLVILFGIVTVSLAHIAYTNQMRKFLESILTIPKPVAWGIGLIGVASLVSLFAFGFDSAKFGQWLVLYAQPLAVFFLLRFYAGFNKDIAEQLIFGIYWLVGLAGLLALLQYFTLVTLPTDWLGNANEPKRALSFFAHPNAYALFVTPLLAWLLPDFAARIQRLKNGADLSHTLYAMLWVVGVLGMFVSLSRGAWFGFAAACVVFAVASRNKKVIVTALVAGVILTGLIAVTPNLRYRITLPFQGEKSTVARFSLWNTGEKMIADSPLLGKGIHGFNYNWDRYNTDPNLAHYNFPHNILLNFWIDLGLFGVIGFVVIIAFVLWRGLSRNASMFELSIALFVVAIIVHGLIDIPYLKNDLALVFWIVMALSFSVQTKNKTASPLLHAV